MYRLFSCCKLTKGSSRSALIDVQRNEVHLIPNILYDILSKNKIIDFTKLQNEYGNVKILKEYEKFLREKEFIFEVTEENKNNFPDIDNKFETPNLISNGVFEVNNQSNYITEKFVKCFDNFRITSLYLVFYESNHDFLLKTLQFTDNSTIRDIKILYPSNGKDLLKKMKRKYSKITLFIFNLSF